MDLVLGVKVVANFNTIQNVLKQMSVYVQLIIPKVMVNVIQTELYVIIITA
jgi:hypothetical protein